MKKINRFPSLLLSLITVLLLLPVSVLAAGKIDLTQPVSLTLSYQDGGTPLTGADFSAYLVATVDESGQLTTTKPFQSFRVDMTGKQDDTWRQLASTLEGYVLRDSVQPTAQGSTDGQGQLTLPTGGKKLTPGLYLILGSRHTQNGSYYDPSPFFVLLPTADREANDYTYQVTADVKYDKTPVPDQPTKVTRTMQKVWKDDGHEKARPQEVVVQLLRGGQVYDTVTLNSQNNWRHRWSDLDSRYRWTVTEKTVADYTVTVTQEGKTFVVTNTYQTPTPGKKTDTKLPQTGQLWWPVPVLLSVGLLLVLIGVLRRRRDDT